MKYLILSLLVIFTAVHLYHSWKDDSKKRPFTKPFLIPLIAVFYLVCINNTEEINTVLLAALATSWLGDVLLIPTGIKWFAAGGISFLVSHISFICIFASLISFESVNLMYVIPAAAVYLITVFCIFRSLIPHNNNKPLFAAMCMYLLANGTMNIFAFTNMVGNPCPASISVYAGALLFFISDSCLFILKFHPNKKLIFKKHFTVMLTYVLGEFLITYGMILTQLINS